MLTRKSLWAQFIVTILITCFTHGLNAQQQPEPTDPSETGESENANPESNPADPIKPAKLDDGKEWQGVELRVFRPSARVYFDVGSDDDNELDVFDDGSLSPSIGLLEFYWPYGYPLPSQQNGATQTTNTQTNATGDISGKWRMGPLVGMGLGAPAGDSPDGSESSGAPVVLFNAGMLFEAPMPGADQVTIGLEAGWAQGISADEGLDDVDDGAIYVGLTLSVPL